MRYYSERVNAAIVDVVFRRGAEVDDVGLEIGDWFRLESR